MNRWNTTRLLKIANQLFQKIHRKKYLCHYNHLIHFLAREINIWLPQGIQSLKLGHYTPQCLKRSYYQKERVDHLHLTDRIFQYLLLKIIKPTFKYVLNQNCYHLAGPSGVKHATAYICDILNQPPATSHQPPATSHQPPGKIFYPNGY